MLNKHLIVKTYGEARKENTVIWEDYRVTVLSPRLFRLEKSENGNFRDEATQAVWYRNMEAQEFSTAFFEDRAEIKTPDCKLILHKDRGQVCVEMAGKQIPLDNAGNLLGTYRTLDCCDGDVHFKPWEPQEPPYRLELCKGVCSKTGVAVLDDSNSLTLGKDGQVKNEKADGSDEYIFAYGNDYRAAVQALYMLTGSTPLVPRYALGNWWSRYHVYTDKEYLRLLTKFEAREIPLTVATVDMDWHYAEYVDAQKGITESGKNSREYVGETQVNYGWTGYSWNTELFPDYKKFLSEIKKKNLKITLNLHPSDGVRWWEDMYAETATRMGQDPAEQKQVPFDFSYDEFINAYFEILHRPYEKDGVDFWWIDWQQAPISWHGDGQKTKFYDPLWALNHYHYLDNADGHGAPLILSRYAGIGSHRYPLGFSGDTTVSWQTLGYLPYFTATATNVGYTWWSHDVGGHNFGHKSDELYARHVQYGVFSPINRLHCTCDETMTKEPWAYGNGAGLIAEEFLRFRHKLIPYLYTASYRTQKEGIALIEPLYYRWDCDKAYEYKQEYAFGSELLVAPVTSPAEADGFARVNAWIPQGVWTDIFTGDEYEADERGKEVTLLRELDSIPVLIKAGGILPLSKDKGNSCKNPKDLEVWAYVGKGEYTLYEDGAEENKPGELCTRFTSEYLEMKGAGTQVLTVSSVGEPSVIPEDRTLTVRFKNIPEGEVRVYKNGELLETEELYGDCAAARIPFESGAVYRIEVAFRPCDRLEKLLRRATGVLTRANALNREKFALWKKLMKTETVEEYRQEIEESSLDEIVKLRLKENL